ncbi:hypothetical protein PT2222_40385 [Paraburkholderia tropica]
MGARIRQAERRCKPSMCRISPIGRRIFRDGGRGGGPPDPRDWAGLRGIARATSRYARIGRRLDRIREVGGARERVRVELVFGQAVMLREIALRRLDHHRRAARVDLMAGQIGQILDHGAVHEARAAGPGVLRGGLGEHRHEAEVRDVLRPLLGEVQQIQVLLLARAPVERHRAVQVLVNRVLDDRLERREAGARREQHDGLVRILAQEEGAERRFEAQDVALFHLREDVVGELAAGHVADVQFERTFLVRGARHRVAAARAVLEDEFEVLAGQILEALVGGQLQPEHDDVVGLALDRGDAGGQLAHLHVADARHFADVDFEVGLRRRAAEQRHAARALVVRQCRRRVRALLDFAAADRALARAAGAVLAAVGQADALTQRRVEDGFVGFDLEGPAALLERYVECHVRESQSVIGNPERGVGRCPRIRASAAKMVPP